MIGQMIETRTNGKEGSTRVHLRCTTCVWRHELLFKKDTLLNPQDLIDRLTEGHYNHQHGVTL